MEDTATTGYRQYVLFRLGDEDYGLPIEHVQSIIRYEPATPVPHAPDAVEGVINLRGQVIPVVDLARRLRGRALERSPSARIIVAEGESGLVGLAVDSASEVATVPLTDIQPAPESVLTEDTLDVFEGVAGYGERLVILLDPAKALPAATYALKSRDEEVDADV
ncbi:MAG: chemotaxis protein CheW [Coriobacteriales bacterium]|nr:chemotaxis protein CheW [Actinomycetes bacterium]